MFPCVYKNPQLLTVVITVVIGLFCLCCCCLFVLHSCVGLYFVFRMGNRSVIASWKILVFPQRKASCEIDIRLCDRATHSLINLYYAAGGSSTSTSSREIDFPSHSHNQTLSLPALRREGGERLKEIGVCSSRDTDFPPHPQD